MDFGSFADEETASGFHLPVEGLFADMEGGHGCVRPTDNFLAASALSRVKIYDDWSRDIQELRKQALKELLEQHIASRPNEPLPEALSSFKRLCLTLGIHTGDLQEHLK